MEECIPKSFNQIVKQLQSLKWFFFISIRKTLYSISVRTYQIEKEGFFFKSAKSLTIFHDTLKYHNTAKTTRKNCEKKNLNVTSLMVNGMMPGET